MSDPKFTRHSTANRLDYLKLHECVIVGQLVLSAAVAEVCKWSQWFEVSPLPDDRYVIFVKHENARRLDEFVETVASSMLNDGPQKLCAVESRRGQQADVSYSRKTAEAKCSIGCGLLSVDELACLMSKQNAEETVSVYDATLPSVSLSKVYFQGDILP